MSDQSHGASHPHRFHRSSSSPGPYHVVALPRNAYLGMTRVQICRAVTHDGLPYVRAARRRIDTVRVDTDNVIRYQRFLQE